MEVFLQSLISGILIGGVYALVGIGLTLIFGVMRIINFAQGDLLMIGMYLTYFLFTIFHIDPYLALFILLPLMFLLGVFLQRFLIDRVLGTLPQNQILLTIGVGLILSNGMMMMFTSNYKILSTSYSSNSVKFAGLSISEPLVYSFIATSIITGALYAFLMKTDTGRAIRATAQDRDAAQLMGVNVRKMSLLAFGIGTALAGAAGGLVSPTYYIFPQVGGAFTLKAFVVVVLGGMGSVIGAMLGGVLIGMTESLAAAFISSGAKEIVVYLLFLIVLLFKPAGLLGKTRD